MDDRLVTCSRCGEALDEAVGMPVEARAPCPKCGSTARTVHLRDADSAGLTDGATLAVHADLRAEAAVTRVVVPDATVVLRGAPTIETLTSMGLEAQHVSTFKWAEVTDGHWLVEVTNRNGDIKAVLCDDAGQADALLALIEYALPPDHPEYPQG